ncbi:hypothetical protein RhiirA5_359526 [Rhizophagus irregularis]|uniref:Uncharacterized protein n=3 Tax=Rhizophagus irregularis TaxID=588596 RepID=U9UZ45_RHIID|nr:hypothetical protein GLOIN_2v1671075 [Rhizophagus irregularis DAOM 181602=DAOM 197198]PKC07143.1 hypothetical protein RhiirA5_359526 [Rhizophagus irregularis]PKC67911.1 hypothetical protein RhiirA1_417559 [Rhizophagus irregularis]PKY31296.1 hypothetical protein RhiirB3_419418 [Rhizophagus irregularis]POG64918.1 hypothetical protein GLOIN_2v1671075 [Rhizophagus irregularis DAOM 181602=DAOM 197198]UZO16902.1 hypothetical protein OCT59_008268 [Rhizophagus irregularis]|eukprot:XP_025171784.1 hypothetical protein GLOIN_2v1671075 [Rhizophagus irregularis DAOM 181602=DAOM 197198]
MVEINENNVNIKENRTEMTTKEEETMDKKVVEDVSIKNNNNEPSTTTMTTTTTTTTKSTTEVDNISHSISIYDEKNNLSIKRIIQIIGKGHSKKNNNVAENSKIQNNDNDNLLIHEFDATTEDPFTLESFDTLIQQHSEKDKDFIIARVTTVDPTDELKSYHSYYSGHHINKVLFRTQPDQGLLHRMKAKNPLNNMNIIGDVHYYVVKASSVKKLPTFTKSSSMSTTSKKTLRVNGESTIMATSSLDKVEKGVTKINIDNIDDIRSNSNKLRSAPPSIWNFERNDDDDDEKFAIEMESTSNNKRWSADDSLKPLPKAITANHNSSTSGADENFERLLTNFKLQTFNNHDDNENNSHSSKIIIPPLVNNEISVSISHNDLKEQQIDSPITLTQSPTKDSHSISINEEEGVEDGTIYYKAKFYATDDDFLMHSVIRHFFKANALEPMDAQLFTINTSSHNNPNVNVTPSARLERIVTGHETYLLDPMVIGNMRPPVARSIDSNELNAVPTSRWRRALNNMRMNKGLRWLVLMYMIFGFLLIRFVVAETYAYLMAFLLMLCLFLVFCVGSGVGIWGR